MLTTDQFEFYHENGYIIIPELFSADEVDVMRSDCERIASVGDAPVVSFAGIQTFYRCYEPDGPSGSALFSTVARLNRTLGSAKQLLGDDELYVFNSRLYCKQPLVGSAMMWHQDFGYWRLDRVPTPNLLSLMVMLGGVDVLDGCVWVVPGTHRSGILPHYADTSTPFKQWPVNQAKMADILENAPKPVPLCGKKGTVAIHHSLMIHASGHNLAATPRWQLYLVYNKASNAPPVSSRSRPDFISSRNTAPLTMLSDDSLAEVVQAHAA